MYQINLYFAVKETVPDFSKVGVDAALGSGIKKKTIKRELTIKTSGSTLIGGVPQVIKIQLFFENGKYIKDRIILPINISNVDLYIKENIDLLITTFMLDMQFFTLHLSIHEVINRSIFSFM